MTVVRTRQDQTAAGRATGAAVPGPGKPAPGRDVDRLAPGRVAPGRFSLSADRALGLAGATLAVASATFGTAMALHGPVGSFGHSGGFTVFAQLAPHRATAAARPEELVDDAGFDDATTASIPRRAAGAASAVTLRAADADAATVVVGGRETVVRVGDTIPGVGAVLQIMPGERPWLRTTGGVIAAAGR